MRLWCKTWRGAVLKTTTVYMVKTGRVSALLLFLPRPLLVWQPIMNSSSRMDWVVWRSFLQLHKWQGLQASSELNKNIFYCSLVKQNFPLLVSYFLSAWEMWSISHPRLIWTEIQSMSLVSYCPGLNFYVCVSCYHAETLHVNCCL